MSGNGAGVPAGPGIFVLAQSPGAAAGNVIQGNVVGTNPAGTAAIPNGAGGVVVQGGSDTTIGGGSPAQGNLVSGNTGPGVDLRGAATGTKVRDNLIGTNAAGTAAVSNTGNGIEIAGSTNNRIGSGAKTRNVVSGNGIAGVLVDGPGAGGNRIAGNFIGTDAKGTAALGNAKAGVQILDASGTMIGGPTTSAGNRIGFNGGRGIVIDDPNLPATGNAIHRNAIFHNGNLGIDLGADGRDADDGHDADADAGPNRHQNFPVVHSASTSGGRTAIRLTLGSRARTAYVIELFSNTACDPSGFGEGQVFVVSRKVVTAADGTATLSFSRHPALPVGRFLTATATDPAGNTSEFSRCLRVTG